MSRSVPWRNKPTVLITQMIPVANQYKLYLVHETGPTSFTFKDDNDNKFKVSIGSTVSCSCGIIQNDHCIHSLYVLLKKFKVPPTNPIIWQASYLDSELEGFVQLKYAQKKKQQKKKHQFKKTSQITKNSQINKNQETEPFPELQEDSMCPICYENMNGECYSSCKTCKKSLHTKCFKVWTKHKEEKMLNVTCPMCRSQFHNPMGMIFEDLQRWESQFLTHKKTFCCGCGMKNIRGSLYICLVCTGKYLCKMCFQGNQHSDHDKYFVKQMTNENWKLAPTRVRKTKQHLFQSVVQINNKQLRSIENPQFMVDIFPTLKQFNSLQKVADLGIVGNQILQKHLCLKCKTPGNQMMKRVNCGHYIHQQCLKFMIKSKQFQCEIDKNLFCPGYLQAMNVKVNLDTKKPVQSIILKNQQEISRINDKINNLEINGFMPKTKVPERRQMQSHNQSKSKDKNFRIMKKNNAQKKLQLGGLFRSNNTSQNGMGNFGMMITGLSSNHQQDRSNLPPKSRSSKPNFGSYR